MKISGSIRVTVNTVTAGNQTDQQVAVLSDGGWVVTWRTEAEGYNVRQQRYDATGSAVGAETEVYNSSGSINPTPKIAALSDGGWVVTWTSRGVDDDGIGTNLSLQRYSADGSPVGEQGRINTYLTDYQTDARVTALTHGGYVVTWTSSGQDGSGEGVYQQLYDGSGVRVGVETQVNTHVAGDQKVATATALMSGGWVVTWISNGQDGSQRAIYQQLYDINGVAVGGETRVPPLTQGYQDDFIVTALPDGGWIVVWGSASVQVFNADGTARGGEAKLDVIAYDPQVTTLANGGWVVTWSAGAGLSSGIYQQVFNADGAAVGDRQRVDQETRGGDWFPTVVALTDGGWVVAWQNENRYIYQRAYTAEGIAIADQGAVAEGLIRDARIKALPDGGWVLTWSAHPAPGGATDVYQRVYHLTNDAPSGADKVITLNEDGFHSFGAADFGFSDPDGDSLAAVIITTLPGHGSLTVNGLPVTAGQTIAAKDIQGLVWTPLPDANGTGLASFTFQVVDNGKILDGSQNTDQTPNTIVMDVSPVNDTPDARDDFASVVEYTVVSGSVRIGHGADVDIDGDALIVTNVAGFDVFPGTTVAGRFGTLTLHPNGTYRYVADNAESLAAGQSGVDVFTYTVSDGHGGTDTAALRITINGTNSGTAGNDWLRGTDASETFNGGGGDDIIDARGGDDKLDGSSGFDVLRGGDGNDTYLLGADDDAVFDLSGVDTIVSTKSRSLANYAGIENLTLLGSAAIRAIGNTANNVIIGSSAANLLDGGIGADQLYGGAGNDVYYVDNVGDRVFEAAGQGIDSIGTSITYALAAGQHIENLRTQVLATAAISLTGNEFDQRIDGNNGANILNGGGGNDLLLGNGDNDSLIGGTGSDQMYGGFGDDVFYVDIATDKVFEKAYQGNDTVLSAVSYALAVGQYIEKLATTSLAGTATIGLTGNEFAQTISGNNGANVISGGGGNDTLLGYGGNDTLNGGDGNDVIYGSAGNDTLTGGAGADLMAGGVGNDVYIVDAASDKVFETANQGNDTVYSSAGFTLSAGQHVETLATNLVPGTATVHLVGNELAQRINGNNGTNSLSGLAGNDMLAGYGGNDWLKGGLGNDTLAGGAGADNFVFDAKLNPATNVDLILDFNVPQDTIRLDNAVMPGLGPTLGTLSAAKFWKSTSGVAHDADDRIIYETDTGKLFYDSNGNVAGGSVHFATLAPNLALTNTDFVVI